MKLEIADQTRNKRVKSYKSSLGVLTKKIACTSVNPFVGRTSFLSRF